MVKRQLTVSINPSTTPRETSQKTQTTVKPFNLAALKVGEFTCGMTFDVYASDLYATALQLNLDLNKDSILGWPSPQVLQKGL